PVFSSTVAPGTAGTTRSRSVIVVHTSSIGLSTVNELSNSISPPVVDQAPRRPKPGQCARVAARFMPLSPGCHQLGPDNGSLRIDTARKGAAAKAGHDLVIEVTSWTGSLEVGNDGDVSALELEADPRSLEVREGHGGVMELKDEDRADIEQTIADEV